MFKKIPFHCSAHPLPCAMIFWYVLSLIYFQSKAKYHSLPFTAFWEDFHISSGNSTNSIAEQTTCQIAFPNGHFGPPQILNPHTITAVAKLFHTALTLTPGLWET